MCLSWRQRITRMRTLVVSPHLRHQTEQLSRLAEKFSLVHARLPQLEVDQGGLLWKITYRHQKTSACACSHSDFFVELARRVWFARGKGARGPPVPQVFLVISLFDWSAFFPDLSLCVLKWRVSVVWIQFRKHPGYCWVDLTKQVI